MSVWDKGQGVMERRKGKTSLKSVCGTCSGHGGEYREWWMKECEVMLGLACS